MGQKRDQRLNSRTRAFARSLQSKEATGVLPMINPRTPCMWVSARTWSPTVYGLVGWIEAARSPHADNEDSSAGVCRLKAPVASLDRGRPAGTQVSLRTLSATLTSIAVVGELTKDVLTAVDHNGAASAACRCDICMLLADYTLKGTLPDTTCKDSPECKILLWGSRII